MCTGLSVISATWLLLGWPSKIPHRNWKNIFVLCADEYIYKDWKPKLEGACSFILKYSKITVCSEQILILCSAQTKPNEKHACCKGAERKKLFYQEGHWGVYNFCFIMTSLSSLIEFENYFHSLVYMSRVSLQTNQLIS